MSVMSVWNCTVLSKVDDFATFKKVEAKIVEATKSQDGAL